MLLMFDLARRDLQNPLQERMPFHGFLHKAASPTLQKPCWALNPVCTLALYAGREHRLIWRKNQFILQVETSISHTREWKQRLGSAVSLMLFPRQQCEVPCDGSRSEGPDLMRLLTVMLLGPLRQPFLGLAHVQQLLRSYPRHLQPKSLRSSKLVGYCLTVAMWVSFHNEDSTLWVDKAVGLHTTGISRRLCFSVQQTWGENVLLKAWPNSALCFPSAILVILVR